MLPKKLLLSLFAIFMLTACAFIQPSGDWPKQIPQQEFFVDYYQGNIENQLYQDLDSYLDWVQTFYLGNPLSPGWLNLTDDLLVETSANKHQEYADLMAELGQAIGAEWAQSNRVRLIDTRSASVWREALLEAVALGDLLNYMQRFEADVKAILSGSLSKEEINFSRYYQEEAFEFF